MADLSHRVGRCNYLLVMLVVCFGQAAPAVESDKPTPPLVGHKPTLDPLALPAGSIYPGAAAMGATLEVSDHVAVGRPVTLADMGIDFASHVLSSFHDKDGDSEGGSFYEWLIDGVVVETGPIFTPTVDHGGQYLVVRVTPKTQTGEPDTGNSVNSNAAVVRSTLVERFVRPVQTHRTWGQAEAYCRSWGNGYRLPTRDELVQLGLEMSSAYSGTAYKSTIHTCTRYGWPLNSRCETASSGVHQYWTNEKASSDSYWTVSMSNGGISAARGSTGYKVTCFLEPNDQPNSAPTATDVAVSGALLVGQELTAGYTYADVEGDIKGAEMTQWYRSDDAMGSNKVKIIGATGSGYTLVAADEGKYLSVEIIPVAVTGLSPGLAVESPLVGPVSSPLIDKFTTPETAPLNWSNANQYCIDRGWKLPTKEELVALYNENPNNTMNTVHGWPTNFSYWSATLYSTDYHYVVTFINGSVGNLNDSNSDYVTCVR